MAPPAVVPWSDGLPIELLLLVLADLQCLADRVSFAAVCRCWRDAERLAKGQAEDCAHAQPPPAQIPWLLSPSPHQVPCITSFLSGSRRRIRRFPADLARGRLCGSHPGGWVAVVLRPFGGHLLANVFSGVRIDLPHRLRHAGLSTVTPVILRAVMLSAAPTAAHGIAGAIVSATFNVAFCRPGVDSHWCASDQVVDGLQDMVYYDGEVMRGFHLVTETGQVGAFGINAILARTPGFAPSAWYYTMLDGDRYTPVPLIPVSSTRTRYLVVSRRKLLMVVRYHTKESGSGVRRTLLFNVFEMQVKTSAKGRHRASWVELEGLDGRVLFVGRGCSRAFEVSQLHGFKEGSIYFLDDTASDISLAFKNEPEFPCSDMGMYAMSEVVRPGLDAPTLNLHSPIYGAKSYLWAGNNTNKEAKNIVAGTIPDEAGHSGRKTMGACWSFPSELLSKFSPPIWFAP